MSSRYLRLDPRLMRLVAADLDAAAEVSHRMGATVPTLADGYDLPPELMREVGSTLSRTGAQLRGAGRALHGMGAELRARAVLAQLADRAGDPGGPPAGLADKLRRIAEDFECPLEDPLGNLLHQSAAAASEGTAAALKPAREALADLVESKLADRVREKANEDLDQCQPPALEPPPTLPPAPPPPPPAEPGLLDRIRDAVDDALHDIPEPPPSPIPGLPPGLPPIPLPA